MSSTTPSTLFPTRSIKICYWNAESRVLDAERMDLEKHLKRLGQVSIITVPTLESPELLGADLLIVAAQMVPEDKFPTWLKSFSKRIQVVGRVWTPALILADMPFEVLSEIWPDVTKENWYFDILAPSHMASLPIRVANLIRIYDHLHEIRRYADALTEVSTKVRHLEGQVAAIKKD